MGRNLVLLTCLTVAASCLPALPDGSPGGGQAASSATDTGACGSGSWRPGWLEIHHIDGGEAVATLIVSPAGRSLLIDAGEPAWDSDAGAKTVGSYVRSVMGCAKLDYVLLSHFHLDHVGFPGRGGLWHLVHAQGFAVGKTLHRDLFHFSGTTSQVFETWRSYMQGDDAQSLHPEIAVLGTGQVQLGGGVAIAIVAVDGNGHVAAGDHGGDVAPPDENDYSIAAVLRMGRLDYFTAGDLSGETLVSRSGGYAYHDLETSVAPQVKDIDVYRVSHHGSSHASNATLVAQMHPRVAILQVADGNPYGHPAQSTVDRLAASSALYLTEHGNLGTKLYAGKVVGHVVVRTSTGIEYTVGGDTFIARDPPRVDLDGDGYFGEADPDDTLASVVPEDHGGCDATYGPCP